MSAYTALPLYQTGDVAELLVVDTGGCQLLSAGYLSVCFFVWETARRETLREHTKSVLSGCVTTKLKFVSALYIHRRCVLHCTLFNPSTQQASP